MEPKCVLPKPKSCLFRAIATDNNPTPSSSRATMHQYALPKDLKSGPLLPPLVPSWDAWSPEDQSPWGSLSQQLVPSCATWRPDDQPTWCPRPQQSLTKASTNNYGLSYSGIHRYHWHWLQLNKSYKDYTMAPTQNQSQSALINQHYRYIYRKKTSLWKPLHKTGRMDYYTQCADMNINAQETWECRKYNSSKEIQ